MALLASVSAATTKAFNVFTPSNRAPPRQRLSILLALPVDVDLPRRQEICPRLSRDPFRIPIPVERLILHTMLPFMLSSQETRVSQECL